MLVHQLILISKTSGRSFRLNGNLLIDVHLTALAGLPIAGFEKRLLGALKQRWGTQVKFGEIEPRDE